jgi:hypothetical protein
VRGTPGARLVGSCGSVELAAGVMAAQRHIHLTPEAAGRFGVKDRQIVKLQTFTERPLIFENLAVRVSPNFAPFVHLDFDDICGGKYDWKNVKTILTEECGWVPPSSDKKALHTSCKVERCKDHSQFLRFYNCESKMIPFSALEISLASRNRLNSKDEIIYEMENFLGFSLEELPECSIMCDFMKE